jgi:hypothetical protein
MQRRNREATKNTQYLLAACLGVFELRTTEKCLRKGDSLGDLGGLGGSLFTDGR